MDIQKLKYDIKKKQNKYYDFDNDLVIRLSAVDQIVEDTVKAVCIGILKEQKNSLNYELAWNRTYDEINGMLSQLKEVRNNDN